MARVKTRFTARADVDTSVVPDIADQNIEMINRSSEIVEIVNKKGGREKVIRRA